MMYFLSSDSISFIKKNGLVPKDAAILYVNGRIRNNKYMKRQNLEHNKIQQNLTPLYCNASPNEGTHPTDNLRLSSYFAHR
jgi:hypothetical protein